MESSPRMLDSVDLQAVQVRATCGAQEHRLWDRLVAAHHYLGFGSLFGKGLRQVATLNSAWVALVGWQAAALKLTVRDRWLGWTLDQQLQRLHLVAQNSRFLILPAFQRIPNLASRVLGLSLQRLAQDMQRQHGYRVLLAESFVDRARFAGTCYRAANWRSLGFTGGYAREPGPPVRWRPHGQPKEVMVYELEAGARAALSQAEEDPSWQGPAQEAPPPAAQLRSLFDCLGEVEDYRCARGQRYPLRTVLTLAIAARLAGYRGVTAFAEFAALLDQEQRRTVGCFFSPSQQCYTTPSITTFHNTLAGLPPETLERSMTALAQQQGGQVLTEEGDMKPLKATGEESPAPVETPAQLPLFAGIAMDGTDVRGASRQTAQGRRMLVAAVEHGSGLVLGQIEMGSRTNEIPAVCELAGRLALRGRIVTFEALHARQSTTRLLRQECQAHYLVTSVKGNQPTILDDLQHLSFDGSPACETLDMEHGRIEQRRYWVQDLSDPAWNGYADLNDRRQAIRIERQTWHGKTGQTTLAACYALTSLSAEEATPAQLAALIRRHWHIENRLHSVRDSTCNEDRCRVAVRHLPRNLACLTNVAISLIRCQSPFEGIPTANRSYAARSQSALDLLLHPPSD